MGMQTLCEGPHQPRGASPDRREKSMQAQLDLNPEVSAEGKAVLDEIDLLLHVGDAHCRVTANGTCGAAAGNQFHKTADTVLGPYLGYCFAPQPVDALLPRLRVKVLLLNFGR